MSVNASPPMAVNDAIMAAADQILAGMKGAAFFPRHANTMIGDGNANGPTAKSEHHASARHSPTTVYHHTGTSSTVAHALRAHAQAECYVKVNDSQSSQVTFDSKEGAEEATATDNGGGGSGLNKNTSALSLASSEVSHPNGSCQPDISAQGLKHHMQVQQGPPMQQVTFSTGTNRACDVSTATAAAADRSTGIKLSACGVSTAAEEDRSTGTKRSATTMEASLQEQKDQPPSQKPRISPPQDGSLSPGSLLVGPTQEAGTPVAQEQPWLPQQQPQLLHHQHPPSDGVQAPGQVTCQPILPAPPAMAKQEGEAKSKPQEVHQAQMQEHSTFQSDNNCRHPKSPNQPTPTPAPVNPDPAQGKHTTGPIMVGHQLHAPPPPPPAGPGLSLVSAPPLAAAQTPAANFALMGSQQPMVDAQHQHYVQPPRPTEWETKTATQPQPPAPATVPVPHRMALPPIYPKPHPPVQYHSHYQPPQLLPPPSQPAYNAMQSYPPPPPAPKQHYAPPPPHQVAMPSIPPHTYHVDNMNNTHQATQFSTDPTTTTASTSGTAATLAAAHSYPYTSTTTTHYYQHQHHHHPVNSYHTTTASATSQSSFAGSNPTAADGAQVLSKPSFHDQGHGSAAETSWSNMPSYTTATAEGPTEASPEDVSNLRNHKMQATDCLLFAASLLQEGPSKSTPRTEGAPASQNASSLADAFSRVVTSPAPAPAQAHLPSHISQAGHAQTHFPSPPTVHNYHAQHPTTSCTPQESTAGKASAPGCPATSAVQKPSLRSDQPQDMDVLCGRGGLINKHVGNIIYRKVVEHNKKFYQTVQKRHRILVSQSIVHTILNRGGRFLSEETKTVTNPDGTRTTVTTWMPVATARAIQKTSQALRERIASSDGSSNGDQNNTLKTPPAAGCAESTA